LKYQVFVFLVMLTVMPHLHPVCDGRVKRLVMFGVFAFGEICASQEGFADIFSPADRPFDQFGTAFGTSVVTLETVNEIPNVFFSCRRRIRFQLSNLLFQRPQLLPDKNP